MTSFFMMVQFIITIIMGLYFYNALKGQTSSKMVIDRENRKEMENLRRMRSISLTEPLSEKSRPSSFDEIIGQDRGIKALQAAICGPNPQHVIIYGPPGVGKTAAARLVLEDAKKRVISPFKQNSKFVEIDATTIRFDDRGIADPLIGSVHDPIYQGAGALGVAGIPQPKPGAVTKAHGGVLFIDEIGELHPIELNKLLKVLEDRKVFLDSAYYSSEDPNMPAYIREVFDNGLPADFRLIGATTRSPEEIAPAIRSRCVEVFFRSLEAEEIQSIANNAVKKMGLQIDDKACQEIGRYCNNGRDAVNLIQLSGGIAINEKRDMIALEDVQWVIENGSYTPRPDKTISEVPQIGYVNGLAVYGANIGVLMEIEANAKKVALGKGSLRITGIVEEEELSSSNRKIKRKSTARCSIENVITVIQKIYSVDCSEYDIHVNFPGGTPVDGPSAGISMACAIYSAIKGIPVDNRVAMTGEISLHGKIKGIGGVNAKIAAGKKAGASRIIIPKENWQESFSKIEDLEVIAVSEIDEAIHAALLFDVYDKEKGISNDNAMNILTAKSV